MCPTLCHPIDCSMPGYPVFHHLPEFAQTHVHWVGDAIQPFHILSFPSPPVFNLFQHRVFSNEWALCIRWPKYWRFNISTFNEYSGLISLRFDWFDLLTVQETLKSPLQHHSLKASVLWSSAFFIVQISHPHMTTRKTIALTIWTFVSKVMSLLFNMLSRFVMAFLFWSKSLNLMAVVTIHSDFGTQENKVCHCFHFFSIYLPWNDGTGCRDLSFLNIEF